MKKIGSLLVLSAILASVAFANVDGFSDIENVVTQGSDSAKATQCDGSPSGFYAKKHPTEPREPCRSTKHQPTRQA